MPLLAFTSTLLCKHQCTKCSSSWIFLMTDVYVFILSSCKICVLYKNEFGCCGVSASAHSASTGSSSLWEPGPVYWPYDAGEPYKNGSNSFPAAQKGFWHQIKLDCFHTFQQSVWVIPQLLVRYKLKHYMHNMQSVT